MTDGDALYRRAHQAQRRRAAADRPGAVRRRRRAAAACCTPRSCAARTPTRASAASTSRRRAQRAGVVAVYTADDLGDYWQPGPLLVPPPPIEGIVFNQRTQVPLAKDKVRHVGEPIAIVVAESRYLAEDAARRHRGRLRAAAGGGRSRSGAARRRAAGPRRPRLERRGARAPDARATTPRRAPQADRRHPRAASSTTAAPSAPIENRGVVAQWDARGRAADDLGHDAGADLRSATAWPRMLGLARAAGARDRAVHRRRLRPEDHDVLPGGGADPLGRDAARPAGQVDRGPRARTSSPPRRSAARSTTPRSRSTRDGRILGVKDVFLHDTGAYDPYGLTVPINSQCTLLGPYVVPNYDSEFTRRVHQQADRHARTAAPAASTACSSSSGCSTSRRASSASTASRSAGATSSRPTRSRYNNEIIYQDFAPLDYDSGNYVPVLDKALEMIGYEQFLARGAAAAARRRAGTSGIGVVVLRRGHRHRPLRRRASAGAGRAARCSVATGIGTQGQGHFTVFAQIVAEQLGVDVARRRRRHRRHRPVPLGRRHLRQPRRGGRRQRRPRSGEGGAREDPARSPAEHFECAEEDLELADGRVAVVGVPGRAISARRAGACKANPLRGAVQPGTEPGLEATALLRPAARRHRERRARHDRRGRSRDRRRSRSRATSWSTTAARSSIR